jgi:adenylate kinase
MRLNVVVMGPPGAGKGTQGDRFALEHGLPKISTGDILRDAIKEEASLGRLAKLMMDQGKLVDDATMVAIVRERLTRPDVQYGFVLDGFPRTVVQAEALDEILRENCQGPLIIVDMQVPKDELSRRLRTRRICQQCGANADPFDGSDRCKRCGGPLVQRIDDSEEVVRKRLDVYERNTKPILDFYRSRPTFRSVNGAQAPDRVAADLLAAVDSVGPQEQPSMATGIISR